MKNKIILVLLILLGITAISLWYAVDYAKEQKQGRKTAENNFYQSQEQNKVWKAKNGLLASEAKTYTLTIEELKRVRDRQVITINDLGIKLKNVTSTHTISTETKYIIQTVVKDSLVHDTLAQCFDYKTEWVSMKGCVLNHRFDGNITTKDSIFSVGEIMYKGWWLFKKPISVRQVVQSFNPNSIIRYNEYIPIRR